MHDFYKKRFNNYSIVYAGEAGITTTTSRKHKLYEAHIKKPLYLFLKQYQKAYKNRTALPKPPQSIASLVAKLKGFYRLEHDNIENIVKKAEYFFKPKPRKTTNSNKRNKRRV